MDYNILYAPDLEVETYIKKINNRSTLSTSYKKILYTTKFKITQSWYVYSFCTIHFHISYRYYKQYQKLKLENVVEQKEILPLLGRKAKLIL